MKINSVLKKQQELIKPESETIKRINETSKGFISDLKKQIKKRKVKADVFIGGSLAKHTIVRKEKYDVDVFVRFGPGYKNEEISRVLGKLLKNKNAKKIHGSRDYYQVAINRILFEIIPVMKIKKPGQAENVTDLSYFHVNYVLDKIRKNKKLADEIVLTKAFVHAQGCYGAEGYIRGFSGYSLELLLCHYKSFIKFLREISKTREKQKLIIDDSEFYKKNEVLTELNESKLQSPIILIDPTFKERNALAGLSEETFKKFKKSAIEFLKKPSADFFIKKQAGDEMRKKYKKELKIVKIRTNKQAGDIAGTKSRKFFDFFSFNLGKEFKIKEKQFEYDEENNSSHFFFVLDKKPDETVKGPEITDTENLTRFRKKHPAAFIKNHAAYAKISHNLTFNQFLKKFKSKYKENLKQMGIKEMIK